VASDPRSIFGRAVRARRLKLGLTQEQLAERADLHWTYISGIERGERNVALLNIVKLAQSLEMTTRDLMKTLP
jgi:transcriptional regulator with XRE-family HTH domain